MPTRADYAKINIACKELGIDKATLICDRYGKTSSKDLTGKEVVDLLGHLRTLGFRPKSKVKSGRGGTTQTSSNFVEIKPGPCAKQQRYILAMWNALGYDVAKLHARCKKQFHVDRFEWLQNYGNLHVLITDLQARCRSAKLNPDPM
jgi:phage gp16-like protein